MKNICEEIKSIIICNLNEILTLRTDKVIKKDGSYVSKGDLFCESLIKDYLTINFPDYFLVSEESPDDNTFNCKQDNIVILDPIDGTENFVSGLKEWGVAVCIYQKGEHVQSMLALPELNEYLISGDRFERYKSRIYGLSSSLSKDDLLMLEAGYEYRIIGCSVYNLFNVIRGAFSVFENPRGAWLWDIIPGLNLALENDLEVLVNEQKYNGELLDPNQKYRFKITNK